MDDDPDHRGNSRRWIMRDSLRRLGTDWIDLYQIHRPEPKVVPPGLNLNPADGGWVSPALEPAARRR